jgi:GntR family transcriptional regulator
LCKNKARIERGWKKLEETMVTALRARQALEDNENPLYVSLAKLLQTQVIEGDLQPGSQLPTIEQIAKQYGVAKVTVRQALGLLADKGLVQSIQGKGTYVATKSRERRLIRLASDWETFLSSVEGNTADMLRESDVVATAETASGGLTPGLHYRRMLRVHSTGEVPYGLLDIYLDRRCYDQAPRDFDKGMIVSLLRQIPMADARRMDQILRITSADIETAGHLDITVNAPIGEVRRTVTNSREEVLYYSHGKYRSDIVTFETRIDVPQSSGRPDNGHKETPRKRR